jgi:hypothetical protein
LKATVGKLLLEHSHTLPRKLLVVSYAENVIHKDVVMDASTRRPLTETSNHRLCNSTEKPRSFKVTEGQASCPNEATRAGMPDD